MSTTEARHGRHIPDRLDRPLRSALFSWEALLIAVATRRIAIAVAGTARSEPMREKSDRRASFAGATTRLPSAATDRAVSAAPAASRWSAWVRGLVLGDAVSGVGVAPAAGAGR